MACQRFAKAPARRNGALLQLVVPRRGFTLVEMVITVAIVAVLATAALPLTELTVKRTKEQELRTSLRQIRDAIDEYKRAFDQGRIKRSADQSGYPESLERLVQGEDDIRSPTPKKIYFLRRIPRDPFGDSTLSPAESWGLRSYASSAEDPQPGEDVYDVYSLSDATGMNGIPYREW